MEKDNKPNTALPVILVVIVLILLYFPYVMITQHAADVVANSYYSPM